jgi:UDP-N-acetyl-D-mannosaminuronic acid dehydrogenase
MMDCEQHGANVFDVIDLINRDYPRGGIASPGLTAGTCLRKDFAFSEERSAAPGMLLAVSRVNESVPLFLVEGMKRRLGPLSGRKVAVLGLAFKADTDDERDSLAHKLIRLLERELADVAIHDPEVATPTQPFEDALRDADAVVVATNHTVFRGPGPLARIAELAAGDPLVVDPWNCFGAAQVFGYASENFVLGLADGAARHLPGTPQT